MRGSRKLESAAAAPPQIEPVTVAEVPRPSRLAKPKPNRVHDHGCRDTDAAAGGATDPGEDAYSEGFRLWEAKRYDQAIASLRAFTSAFPKHRRVSWANNLVGRSLLEKGESFAAAQAFLANYRANPKGGRAQDSLYYLGQSLLKYGQPAQACKAYGELTSVYGDSVRPELKALAAQGSRRSELQLGVDPQLLARFAADLDALVEPGTRIGVAVSGGPDSLALLLLCAARPARRSRSGNGRSRACGRKAQAKRRSWQVSAKLSAFLTATLVARLARLARKRAPGTCPGRALPLAGRLDGRARARRAGRPATISTTRPRPC